MEAPPRRVVAVAALLTMMPPCTVWVDRSVCRSDRRAGGRARGRRSIRQSRAGQERVELAWPGDSTLFS